MSMPNKNGVFTEGLERMEFSGIYSNVELSIVSCPDGLWRYGLSGEIKDRLQSLKGFGFGPNALMRGYPNKEDCIKEACSELKQRINRNRDENPFAVKELTEWINSLLFGSRQMSLF